MKGQVLSKTQQNFFEAHIAAGLDPADLKYLKATGSTQLLRFEPEKVLFNGKLLSIE